MTDEYRLIMFYIPAGMIIYAFTFFVMFCILCLGIVLGNKIHP